MLMNLEKISSEACNLFSTTCMCHRLVLTAEQVHRAFSESDRENMVRPPDNWTRSN